MPTLAIGFGPLQTLLSPGQAPDRSVQAVLRPGVPALGQPDADAGHGCSSDGRYHAGAEQHHSKVQSWKPADRG